MKVLHNTKKDTSEHEVAAVLADIAKGCFYQCCHKSKGSTFGPALLPKGKTPFQNAIKLLTQNYDLRTFEP